MPKFTSWDDEKFEKDKLRESRWYKALSNHADVIHILETPSKVMRHTWETEKNPYNSSMCSMEQHKKCPICKALANDPSHKYEPCYATTIIHLTRKADGGNPKFVGKVLAWRFGNDKKTQLIRINQVTGGQLLKVDLEVVVKDEAQAEQFQKLLIDRIDKERSVLKSLLANEKFADKLKAAISDKAALAECSRLFWPTPDDLAKLIRAKGTADDDEEDPAFDVDDLTGSKPAKKAAPRGEFEEDEPEDEPPAKKPSKPAAKKPTKSEEEELEEDDTPAKKSKGEDEETDDAALNSLFE